jgi:hypothetical protein
MEPPLATAAHFLKRGAHATGAAAFCGYGKWRFVAARLLPLMSFALARCRTQAAPSDM